MISVRLANQLSVCGKNFNVAIFSNTIYMMIVKLCMTAVLILPHPFMPLSVTLIVFHCTVLKKKPVVFGLIMMSQCQQVSVLLVLTLT